MAKSEEHFRNKKDVNPKIRYMREMCKICKRCLTERIASSDFLRKILIRLI
jgi:hypothetical protein